MAWDNNSGIRERLALLAALGPTMTPIDWGYNPSRDYWYRCGSDASVRSVNVRQEGSASLDIIITKHAMNRQDAMAFIGHPEQR
jgi:hypothetical protein